MSQPTECGVPYFDARNVCRVQCPLCGKRLAVVTFPNEPGWHYPSHADDGPDDERCDNSGELLPPKETT